MHRWLLVAALALALIAPGCLGSVSAAEIPAQTLSNNGWSKTSDVEESLLLGLVKKVTRDYRPGGAGGSLGAGVTVVSATDVPIVDESRFIPQALEQIEEEKGIEFRELGARAIELINFGSEQGTEYDIRGAAVPGKALIFTPPCGDFVVVVAFGASGGGGGGLFGGGGGDTLYQKSLSIARHVTC